MQIVKSIKFNNQLKEILYFISLDSKQAAKNFKNVFIKKVNDLVFMPYKNRQSIYFDSEDIRDLIFKGYVAPYKIDKSNNQIIIIGINKYKSNL